MFRTIYVDKTIGFYNREGKNQDAEILFVYMKKEVFYTEIGTNKRLFE